MVDATCQTDMIWMAWKTLNTANIMCKKAYSQCLNNIVSLEKQIQDMQLEIVNLKGKITQLQEQLDLQTLSEEVLKKNNQLLKFYTGM